MHAITLPSPGGPEVLTWADVPDPVAGPGEVLIEVAAAGVNRADLLQRQGHYPPPSGAPPYPGLECSGHIAAVGDGVATWRIGDPVCALLSGGGYAERVVARAGHVLPVPAGVELIDAAALPEVACTVWSNVFMTAELTRGEVFLVHGGASGIGTMAIQLAAHRGARVFTTAGSSAKISRCLELGAEVAIDYRNEDFAERVSEETATHGADVILDIVGAAYLPANVRALADDGRLVIIGLQGGRVGELDIARLLAKRASVTATALRSRSPQAKAAIVAEVAEHVWPAIANGDVRPVVDRRISMPDASEAHRAMEASEHIGKIILIP